MTEVIAAHKTFEELISGDESILVNFYTDGSVTCGEVKIILQELQRKLKNNLLVLKIDVNKNPKLSKYYNIHSVPTLMVFKNNEIRWRHTGLTSVMTLERILKENL